MPPTEVIFFADADGACPLLHWLDNHRLVPVKARDKCIAKVERLAAYGHELRRPDADYLRDAIHELRVRLGRVNYRMLYFFHERGVVITHGFTKEDEVPDREIELAIARRRLFLQRPDNHSFSE